MGDRLGGSIKAVVLEESPLMRRGLAELLSSVGPAVEVVAAVGTPTQLGPVHAGDDDRVVLVVSSDAERSGVDKARERIGIELTRVLVVMRNQDDADFSRATRLAADGFVLEAELDERHLLDVIAAIGDDDIPMPAGFARYLLRVASGDKPRGDPPRGGRSLLSPREWQVLRLLVAGASNKSIGRGLGISQHGAKRHVANILAKLNCSNRNEAVAKAMAEGLVADTAVEVA